MKLQVLKLSALILIYSLSSSCDKLETEADYPGVSIYKTKGDYFNLVDIGMKGDEIYRTNSFYNGRYDSYHFIEFKNNDTLYTQRYKLPGDYVLDSEADERYDVFLNMTHKEHLKREIINSELGLGLAVSDDTLRAYIMDKDPYTEFYRNKTDVKRLYLSDSLEIKEIILNGEIDKYFEKIKWKSLY